MIEWLNSNSIVWTISLAEALIQHTLFLMVLFGLLHLLKNIPARIKYNLAFLGLIKLLVPPLLPLTLEQTEQNISLPFVYSEQVSSIISGAEQIALETPTLNYCSIIIVLWMTISLILVFLTLRSALKLRQILKDSSLIQTIDGSNHIVQIYQNEHINIPITTGLFSKRIYVPALWQEWTPECRSMVLKHELAHIQRNDSLIQVLQALVTSLFFFHPLVWLLNRRLSEYREMACDELSVGTQKYASIKYSRYLTQIAEQIVLAPETCPPLSAMIRKKNLLSKRVNHLLKEAPMQHISKIKNRLLFGGLLLMIPVLSLHLSFGMEEKKEQVEIVKIEDNNDSPVEMNNQLSKAILIEKIQIIGNKHVETEAVLAVIESKEGEAIDHDQLDKDLRSVYRMGFFEDVKIELKDDPNGKVVIFVVTEKPSIEEKSQSTIDPKIHLTADTIRVSENVTKLVRNALITFDKSLHMTVNADKVIRNENEFILKGNVEIISDNLVIHTEEATVLTTSHSVKVKMDSGEITNIKLVR